MGPVLRSGAPGQRLLRTLTAAGTAGVVIALPACGSPRSSGSPGSEGSGSAAAPTVLSGTTTEIGDSVDVINARIPAPPRGSATAQVEVTLADTSAAGPDTLRAASSPAARTVVFTSNGHAVPQIVIPVAAGSSLSTGPPNPDRILLTGLRLQLHAGQTVTITLAFARAGRSTLQVPVIPSVP